MEDIHARLISLSNAYEQHLRNFMLLDRESLFGQAKSYKPDLPDDASKDVCANVIMEHSRLGQRIAELEQLEAQENALIECLMPNHRVVDALLAGGYVCKEIGPFLYRTDAALQDGIPFETGGETLIRRGNKVFPVAKARDRVWLQKAREGGNH